MSAARVYTESVSVRIPATIRDDINSRIGDTGLQAAMRDACLRVIGREDLVFGDQRDESGHKRARKSAAKWAVIPVRMTVQQKRAVKTAAKSRDTAMSALILDSILFELRLAPREASGRGYPLGKRRSSPPKPKSDPPKRKR